jgi:hypothetical protein
MHRAGERRINIVDDAQYFLMLTYEQRTELIKFLGGVDMDCRLWEQIMVARMLMERFSKPDSIVSPTSRAIEQVAVNGGLEPKYFSREYVPVDEAGRLTEAIADIIRAAFGFDVVDEMMLRLAGYLAQPYERASIAAQPK